MKQESCNESPSLRYLAFGSGEHLHIFTYDTNSVDTLINTIREYAADLDVGLTPANANVLIDQARASQKSPIFVHRESQNDRLISTVIRAHLHRRNRESS